MMDTAINIVCGIVALAGAGLILSGLFAIHPGLGVTAVGAGIFWIAAAALIVRNS